MVWVRLGLVVFVLAWLFDIAGSRVVRADLGGVPRRARAQLQYFFGARRVQPRAREREEAEELLLVRDGGDEFWIPYSGESPEEIEELVAKARQSLLSKETQPDVPPRRRSFRPLLVGLGVIAALAAIVWIAGPDAAGTVSTTTRKHRRRRASLPRRRGSSGGRSRSAATSRGESSARCSTRTASRKSGATSPTSPRNRCHDLYRQAFEGGGPFSQTARAVAVLAHESWHLRGERDEGRTSASRSSRESSSRGDSARRTTRRVA